MDPSISPPTNSSKNLLAAGLAVAIVILVIVAGYIFMNSQSLSRENKTLANQNSLLQTQLSSLKDEKAQLEKDLIFYQNTDLAKDNESLRLKLGNAERDLAAAQSRIGALEANDNKMELYLDAISAIEQFLGAPFTQNGLANIDSKINALGDTEVSSRWMIARGTVDFSNNGWGPHDFFQVVFLLDTRIRGLLQ